MSWVAAATLGAGAIAGGASIYGANKAADTSAAAAADTFAKQQAAAAQLRRENTAAGQAYNQGVQGLVGNFDQYRGAGGDALRRLLGGLGLPGGDGADFTAAYRSLPGYESSLKTGTAAAIRAANAGGTLASGGTLKALQRFGSDYEDQRVGDYIQRLMGLNQMGYNATGAATGLQQEGFRGLLNAQTGANSAAGAMDFNAAGTVGQGQVAGAQTRQDALQNLIGAGAYTAGNYFGGKGNTPVAQPAKTFNGAYWV